MKHLPNIKNNLLNALNYTTVYRNCSFLFPLLLSWCTGILFFMPTEICYKAPPCFPQYSPVVLAVRTGHTGLGTRPYA